MAIKRILGFDDGRTIEQIATSTYSTTYNFINVNGRTGSCLQTRYYGHAEIPTEITGNRITMGFWFRSNYLHSSSSHRAPLFLLSAEGYVHLQLWVSSGTLSLYHQNTTNLLGQYSTIPNDTWVFLEIDAVIDAAAGSVTVRMDETEIISVTGVNTKYSSAAAAVVDRVKFGGNATSSSSTYNRFDDIYIADDGVLLGPVSVRTVKPSAAGANSGLTGSDGDSVDNHLLVNDNDAATHVESPTAGDKDTYAFGDLVGLTGAVKAVQVNGLAQKSEAGDISGRFLVRSGGADYGGADEVLDVALKSHWDVFEQNPATTAPWTPSEVDAAEFGWEARA